MTDKSQPVDSSGNKTIYDRDHPQVKPYMSYFGSRPRGMSDSDPLYCPDRDFSQLVGFLDSVETFICNGQAESVAEPIIGNIVKFETQQELLDATAVAFEAFIKFCDAAAGIDHRKGVFTVTRADEFKGFLEAEQEFFDNAGPGLPYLIVLFSRCVMDRLFFAARQDRLLDRVGKLSSYEAVTLAINYSTALRQNDTDATFERTMRLAVQLGLASGLSGSQVAMAVDKYVVELTSK